MTKTGIMTFHASYNCGSILQALALQRVLAEDLGVENEIIDFSNAGQQAVYSAYYPNDGWKNLAKNILCAGGIDRIRNHYDDYQAFIDENLRLSSQSFGREEELRAVAKDYDALICGSDQVWNVDCLDGDDAYFLSFASEAKKVAYAPSFGGVDPHNSPEKRERVRGFLQSFSALSAREHNGKKWMESLTGREVELLLDPTLLFDADRWRDVMKNGDGGLPDQPYIFYYAFAYNRQVNEAVRAIARKTGMPVVVMDAKQWRIKGLARYGFQIPERGGPNLFLQLVDGASLILTTSFHGTAFSTIFRKPFWFVNSAMHSPADDRAESLLGQLDLLDRYADIPALLKMEEKELLDVNFNAAESKLDGRQKASMDYLARNLSESKDHRLLQPAFTQ